MGKLYLHTKIILAVLVGPAMSNILSNRALPLWLLQDVSVSFDSAAYCEAGAHVLDPSFA